MPTAPKPKTTSRAFSAKQMAAAIAAAAPEATATGIDWKKGTVTPGGGVAQTIAELRRTRGKNKKPTKEQVAIRFDRDVLDGFQAGGPGWQTRMNAALKEWLQEHAPRKTRAAAKVGR